MLNEKPNVGDRVVDANGNEYRVNYVGLRYLELDGIGKTPPGEYRLSIYDAYEPPPTRLTTDEEEDQAYAR